MSGDILGIQSQQPPSGDGAVNPRLCRVCKKPIEPGAIKCTECGSYQNWRRFVGANEIVLSLLVALTTVLTAAVPVIRRAVTPNRADMHLRPISCHSDSVQLFAFNAGNTPAVLDSAKLVVDGEKPIEFDLINHDRDDVFAKETGRVLSLDIKLNGTSASLPALDAPKTCAYAMNFKFVDYHYDQPAIKICCDSVAR